MHMHLCSKSINKYMRMINTEFKIVFISREGGRQGGRSLGQGILHKEFPIYLFQSFKMHVCTHKVVCLVFVKARGAQNMILNTFPMFEMHNKKKSYDQLYFETDVYTQPQKK